MLTPEPFTRGSLRFEAKWDAAEDKPTVAMFEVDCYKPPLGTVKDFAWARTIDLVFEPGFLHKAELERLLAGARQPSDAAFGVAELLRAIEQGFKLRTITVDETKLPPDWKNAVACFITTVSYLPYGVRLKVTATTTQPLAVGGEDFPADDQIAWFKIWYPEGYRFVRHHKWNLECCPEQPKTVPPDESTKDHYPGEIDWSGSGFDGWKILPMSPQLEPPPEKSEAPSPPHKDESHK
jgi:hypothetical protein